MFLVAAPAVEAREARVREVFAVCSEPVEVGEEGGALGGPGQDARYGTEGAEDLLDVEECAAGVELDEGDPGEDEPGCDERPGGDLGRAVDGAKGGKEGFGAVF